MYLLYYSAVYISQNNICFFHNRMPLLTHAELMIHYNSQIFATYPLISHQVFREAPSTHRLIFSDILFLLEHFSNFSGLSSKTLAVWLRVICRFKTYFLAHQLSHCNGNNGSGPQDSLSQSHTWQILPVQYWTADSRLLTVICQQVLWVFCSSLVKNQCSQSRDFWAPECSWDLRTKVDMESIAACFSALLFIEPAKLEAHDLDHNSLGAYENAIWGGVRNFTKFLPVHMTCYPIIGKTNKQTVWFDTIWSWQITLITTYRCALLHIIWSLVQGTFWERKVRSTGTLCPLFFFFF